MTKIIKAELPEPIYDALLDLAKRRGVSPNVALQDAIEREVYLYDKERQGGSVLIEGADRRIKRIVKRKK